MREKGIVSVYTMYRLLANILCANENIKNVWNVSHFKVKIFPVREKKTASKRTSKIYCGDIRTVCLQNERMLRAIGLIISFASHALRNAQFPFLFVCACFCFQFNLFLLFSPFPSPSPHQLFPRMKIIIICERKLIKAKEEKKEPTKRKEM